jgi:hypothetical protein
MPRPWVGSAVRDLRKQPFRRAFVAVVDSHAHMTAVAIRNLLICVGGGQVPG